MGGGCNCSGGGGSLAECQLQIGSLWPWVWVTVVVMASNVLSCRQTTDICIDDMKIPLQPPLCSRGNICRYVNPQLSEPTNKEGVVYIERLGQSLYAPFLVRVSLILLFWIEWSLKGCSCHQPPLTDCLYLKSRCSVASFSIFFQCFHADYYSELNTHPMVLLYTAAY